MKHNLKINKFYIIKLDNQQINILIYYNHDSYFGKFIIHTLLNRINIDI